VGAGVGGDEGVETSPPYGEEVGPNGDALDGKAVGLVGEILMNSARSSSS